MQILILGGQGFIGQNLSQRLIEEGNDVTVLEKKINPNRIIEGVKYIEDDFLTLRKDSFENIEVVYHLISTTNANNSNKEMIRDIEENVISTIKLLNICVEQNIKKIIFASSGGTIYGIPNEVPIKENHPNNPICSYGITKLTIEKYLRLYYHLYGLDYVSLRIANPYGPFHQSMTQGLINVILEKALQKETVEIWGDGNVKRDYIYIDDVIEALSISKTKELKEKVINIGSGHSYSIYDIINGVEEATGEKVSKKFTEARNQDVPVNVLDISLAKKELGWEPSIDLLEGIQKTYNYILNKNEEVNHFGKER